MRSSDLVTLSPIDDVGLVEHLLTNSVDLDPILAASQYLARQGHGERITYSRKVFVPLTQLCRDRCGYCTFARPAEKDQPAFMSVDQVLEIARRGGEFGCHEVLFTLGDRPEARWKAARDELKTLGFGNTIDYLVHASKAVLEETGLLPHSNCGILDAGEMAALRRVTVSQGLMLEQLSQRLLQRGQAHFAAPDKVPAKRLAVLELAGRLNVPFTTGGLIGIGETIRERAETLLTLGQLGRLPHVQEIIIQNFKPKPGTLMHGSLEPSLEEFLRAVAVTRLCLGPEPNLQAPPNLTPSSYGTLIRAGINDFGGVSPLTIDFVNPEAPWPHLMEMEAVCAGDGYQLVERLAIYPEYLRDLDTATRWLDPLTLQATLRASDSEGLAREELWFAGSEAPAPSRSTGAKTMRSDVAAALKQAELGQELEEAEIGVLLTARGSEYRRLCEVADEIRRSDCGETVTFAINRNINYTNICYFRCQFCAFSKGKLAENLRGRPYRMGIAEVVERTREARQRGATEVCMQGGIHPDYTGDFYLELLSEVKAAVPEIHVHAFSPLEVFQGAKTSGRTIEQMLLALKAAGLGSLPGTAAEILDDRIRKVICPDKLSTEEWVHVVSTAHRVGIPTTSTIMFGHVEGPEHLTQHLSVLRNLQKATGGITEFVPLPFVHMEAPMYRKGKARRGPTFSEAIKLHAVARLALRGWIDNIQCSWVKLGAEGCVHALRSGCNDLGGTLMNESISRAAGASHGQELGAEEMVSLIRSIEREPAQRGTLYQILKTYEAIPA